MRALPAHSEPTCIFEAAVIVCTQNLDIHLSAFCFMLRALLEMYLGAFKYNESLFKSLGTL
jgi:hypothetical protein